jgi:hypothetical protein
MKRKVKPDAWIENTKVLFEHWKKVNGQCLWTLRQELGPQDVIVQFWVTNNGKARYYMVRIWPDGSGWDVYGQLDDTNMVKATLEKIL